MFVIKKSDSYFWPVLYEQAASGGEYEKCTFEIKFKRVGQSFIQEFAETRPEDTSQNFANELVKKITVGWKGIVEDGQDVLFSEESLDRFLDFPGWAVAVINAWSEAISGSKRKN